MKKYALAALAAVALACSPLVISSASAAAAASTAQAAAVKAAASNTTVADGSTAITPAETRAAVPPRGQITRPDFPATPPGTFNQQAVSGVHWQLCPAFTTPLLPAPAAADNITIAGPATATQEQMVRFIRKRNPQPKLTCSLEEIVGYYYEEAGREGVRPDVALCQALKETGFFNYGGDVAPAQNNFCGLGATGNHEPGARFATAQLGVRAHIQHLLAYSRMEQPSLTVNDPRYWLVVQNHPEIHGQITHWTGLNGVWAVPGRNYGQEILQLWQQAMAPDASDASLRAAEQRVEQAPKDAPSHLYRGIVRYQRGDYEKARQDFTQTLRYAPHTPAALYNRALAASQLHRDKDARRDYDTLLKLTPNFNQAWYNRGLLRFTHRDYKGALSDMETLLRLEPRSADAQNLIGVIQVRQKHYADAWRSFSQAAQINSTNYYILANQIILQACLK